MCIRDSNDTISDRITLPLGDSDTTEAKDVYALGFPAAADGDIPQYTSEDVTLTGGIVSKITQASDMPVLQLSLIHI